MVTNCPSDITKAVCCANTINAAYPGAVVTWQEPTATDAVSAVRRTYRSHTSGNLFQIGITPVRYEFSDVSNNIATCRFNVNVVVGEYELCVL